MKTRYFFNPKQRAIAVSLLVAPALLLSGCGGDSSSSSGGSSGSVIKAFGGLGGKDGGSGGDGDYFETYSYSGGKNIVSRGGSVDASFSATNLSSANTELGENPLIVSADMSLAAVGTAANKPANGTYYLEGVSPWRLMLSDGNTASFNAAEEVSGLQVNSNRTLTLENNNGNVVDLNLDYDVLVKGTLTVEDISATERADLDITANSVLVWGSGVIDTAGSQDGQDAGYIDLSLSYSFINHGKVHSFGADSDTTDAGDGNYIYVDAGYRVENTGHLLAHGGDSTSGQGGDAGYVDMYAGYGNMLVRNKVHAYGGNGSTDGGDGDDIILEAEQIGDARISGQIWSFGGNGADGYGGDADYIDVYSYGGGVYINADIRAHGGDADGISDSAGDGGDFYIFNEYGDMYEYTPPKGIFVAGNIETFGGDADADGSGSGGDGGYVYADLDADDYAMEQPIEFRGFRRVDVSGGDGQYGGNGGDIDLYADYGWNDSIYTYIPSGGIDVNAALIANGGNALADATGNGYGGDGGDMDLETDYEESHIDASRGQIKVSARIELSGGQSNNSTSNANGEGGDSWIWGYNGVSLASLTSDGGDDVASDGGTDGYGGYSGYVDMASELGTLSVSRIKASGGDGEYRGATADYVYLAAPKISVGSLVVNGGNADDTLAGSIGGDTDDIWIYSPQGPNAITLGSLQSNPGTGTTPGDADNQYIDVGGVCSGLGC